MPSRCCVPRCKGNYPTGPKVTIFAFPKDETLAREWGTAIKRDNFTPNQSSRVCELHFVPEDIERVTSYCDERTGTNLTVNLKIPRLRKGAIPSQLPNCPTYLSRTPLLRESPEESKCRKEQEGIKTDVHTREAAEAMHGVFTDNDASKAMTKERGNKHHWCYVPMCTNTGRATPEKTFVAVPKDTKIRKRWWLAALRDFPMAKGSTYCCEDHFDLEEDAANYLYHKLMGGRIKLKEGVVPHKFECQGRLSPPNEKRMVVARKRIIQEALQDQESISGTSSSVSSEGNKRKERHIASSFESPINHERTQKRKRQPMEDTIEVMVGLQNISSFSEDLIKPECPANTGEMSMNSRDISAISAAVWRPSHETTPLNPPNPSFSTHETPPTPSEIEAKAVLDGPSLQEEYDPLFIIPEVFIKVEDRSDFEPTVIPAVTLMVEESLKPEPDMGTTIKSEID